MLLLVQSRNVIFKVETDNNFSVEKSVICPITLVAEKKA